MAIRFKLNLIKSKNLIMFNKIDNEFILKHNCSGYSGYYVVNEINYYSKAWHINNRIISFIN
jgi:hypothetical protein